MKYFELQPLRIFAGWTVKYNNFTEYDPQEDGAEYDYELNEDMLWLERDNLWIDLGWYPAMDMTGSYVMYFMDKNRENPYQNPIEVFESKSKKEIISKLEYWMNWGYCGRFLERRKK